MIVYSHRTRPYAPSLEAARLRDAVETLLRLASPSDDALVDVLIRSGELESAVLDAICPASDDFPPLAAALRDVTLAIAAAFLASVHHDDAGRHAGLTRSVDRLDALGPARLPQMGRVGVQEGFAYFDVRPEHYIASAVDFVRAMRPTRVTCLGVRSIGSTLSALVAATLQREGCVVRSMTVRPHGHPSDRTLLLSERLATLIRSWDGQHVAIVDEGPGLSGSTMSGVAAAMLALGIPADRIVLFPSRLADPAQFASPLARRLWSDLRTFVTTSDDMPGLEDSGAGADVAAGQWRTVLPGAALLSPMPAVNPAHERRKYYLPERHRLVRFAGRGAFGEAAFSRAVALHSAGFGPQPHELVRGYLHARFVAGRPAARHDLSPSFLDRMARYLAWLRRHQATSIAADPMTLRDMTLVNAGEALAAAPAATIDRLLERAQRDEPAVMVDGRMLPHEWIVAETALVKVDALDHHCDEFFPGAHDIAWDVAGACVEFDLDASGAAAFVALYRRHSGDRQIDARLPFYRLAYLAYRVGYATLSSRTMRGSDEEPRFNALLTRYSTALAHALARDDVTAPSAP